MTRTSAVSAIAEVTASLVDDYDVVSALSGLVASCGEVLGAYACGVLVGSSELAGDASAASSLELLASSSHGATELELYQLQVGEGPCIDAVTTNDTVSVLGTDALTERWPAMSDVMLRNGLQSVHAVPMRWRGEAFGALNLFMVDERRFSADEMHIFRAFADVATIAIVHAKDARRVEALARDIQEALDGRTVIEQAKGVLAVQEEVNPGEAFDLLVAHAGAHGESLAVLAANVVERAERGQHWRDV